jgi:serine protease Do
MRTSVLHALVVAAAALMTAVTGVSPVAAAGVGDPGLPDLVATLLPSVVNITTTRYKAVQVPQGNAVMQQKGETDLSIWFGSGFIVRPDGYVVTNKHVVHNGVHYWVTLNDGKRLPAELVAEAVGFDVALIKVRTENPLPAVTLGDSDAVRQGDFVIAIGNPLHHTSTVTTGIISALNRDIGTSIFDDYIQTDAAINQGNSGGPLFNAKGEVIGVNSAIFTTGADTGNVGIGFAIPINDAKFVVTHMRDFQSNKARPAYLGALVQSLSPDLAEAYGLPGPWGSLVLKVANGTPAAQVNLRPGDVILSFEDKDARDSRALMRDIVETLPGTTVTLGVVRDGKVQKVPVTLGELPANETYGTFLGEAGIARPNIPANALANFGLQLAALTPELRAKYKLDDHQEGALITGVAIGSTAADSNINAGSVILQLRGALVTSPGDVVDDIGKEREQKKSSVPVLLSEPSGLRWVSLRLDGS